MNTLQKIVFDSNYLLKTIIGLLEYMNEGSRKANVCIFHSGRCGSTVLSSMLNQHGNLWWSGEIYSSRKHKYKNFHIHQGGEPELILKMRMFRHRSEIYGMELKGLPNSLINCLNMDMVEFIELLKRNNFSHFILLERKNYLRSIISAVVGSQSGQKWHVQQSPTIPQQVVIDLENVPWAGRRQSLIAHLDRVTRYYDSLRESLGNVNTLEISYEEDILLDPRVAYAKVCEFIGVAPGSPDIKLGKTNPFTLSDIIVNFDEVAQVLETTSYRWMLND